MIQNLRRQKALGGQRHTFVYTIRAFSGFLLSRRRSVGFTGYSCCIKPLKKTSTFRSVDSVYCCEKNDRIESERKLLVTCIDSRWMNVRINRKQYKRKRKRKKKRRKRKQLNWFTLSLPPAPSLILLLAYAFVHCFPIQ